MGTTELAVVADAVGGDGHGAAAVDHSPGDSIQAVDADGVVRRRGQRGMVSAEWAVGIIAAVALAGVLIAVVTNGPVQDALLRFVLQVIKSFSSYIVG